MKSHDQLDNQAVTMMKGRISELELQLEEARSEAQAYFKGAIERNLDSVKLGNKVRSFNFLIFNININFDNCKRLLCHTFSNFSKIRWATITRHKLL